MAGKHFEYYDTKAYQKATKSMRRDLNRLALYLRQTAPTRAARAKLFGVSQYKMRMLEQGRYIGKELLHCYVLVGGLSVPKWVRDRFFIREEFLEKYK